jgi:hypothetical protein
VGSIEAGSTCHVGGGTVVVPEVVVPVVVVVVLVVVVPVVVVSVPPELGGVGGVGGGGVLRASPPPGKRTISGAGVPVALEPAQPAPWLPTAQAAWEVTETATRQLSAGISVVSASHLPPA